MSSTIFVAIWRKHKKRADRDEEEPLLGGNPSPHPKPSTIKLVLAAFAILFGGCVSALCGLGGENLGNGRPMIFRLDDDQYSGATTEVLAATLMVQSCKVDMFILMEAL